jgi:hypothetical protein
MMKKEVLFDNGDLLRSTNSGQEGVCVTYTVYITGVVLYCLQWVNTNAGSCNVDHRWVKQENLERVGE